MQFALQVLCGWLFRLIFPIRRSLYEEIIRFAKIVALLGVKKVRLTGGEPLARKDIGYLLREINSIEGIEDVSLTTNGVFLGERIEELKEAGLKRINISLDTMKKERFAFITGVDAFDDVIRGIEKAILRALTLSNQYGYHKGF